MARCSTPSAREANVSANSPVMVTTLRVARRPCRARACANAWQQTLGSGAQRRCVLRGFGDAAVFRARSLEMNAADVPADNDAHVASRGKYARYTIVRSSRSAQALAMEVIPVLDLKGGVVVHARMGQRDQYRPIETPLAPTSKPADVARGLLAIYPFTTPLRRRPRRDRGERRQQRGAGAAESRISQASHSGSTTASPTLSRAQALARCRSRAARPGQRNANGRRRSSAALAADDRVVLSLDFRGDAFSDPSALLTDARCWPRAR